MCFNLIVFEITTLHSVKWSKKTLRVNYSNLVFRTCTSWLLTPSIMIAQSYTNFLWILIRIRNSGD
ncbi:hypothetical protein WDU94_010037 [Cyamophila willieti]